MSVAASRMAGANPKSTPVATVAASVKRNTGPSNATSSRRGRSAGPKAVSTSMPNAAIAVPRTAPKKASKRLSVRIWRPMRNRPAPNAARTAISLPRSAMRERSRLMTLTQATRSRRPVAPRRVSNAVRVSPITASCSGIIVIPYARFQLGYSASSRLAIPSKSARAAGTSISGPSRPITSIHRAYRPGYESRYLLSQKLELPGTSNPAGMTPTTVYGFSSTVIDVPITSASPPNRRCQKP